MRGSNIGVGSSDARQGECFAIGELTGEIVARIVGVGGEEERSNGEGRRDTDDDNDGEGEAGVQGSALPDRRGSDHRTAGAQRSLAGFLSASGTNAAVRRRRCVVAGPNALIPGRWAARAADARNVSAGHSAPPRLCLVNETVEIAPDDARCLLDLRESPGPERRLAFAGDYASGGACCRGPLIPRAGGRSGAKGACAAHGFFTSAMTAAAISW